MLRLLANLVSGVGCSVAGSARILGGLWSRSKSSAIWSESSLVSLTSRIVASIGGLKPLLLIKEAILNRVSQQPAVLIPYERCAMLRKEGFVSHRLRYDPRLARYKTVPSSDGSLAWPSLTISRICNSDVVDCLRAAKVNSFRLATRSAVSMPNTRSSFAL